MSANREGFKARYAECEIIGPREVREVSSEDRHFTPHPREIPSSANNLGAVLAIARSARPVAWLDSACVWQLQRRGGYHYELAAAGSRDPSRGGRCQHRGRNL